MRPKSALDNRVLVLNRSYQPIHITTVRRALIMMYNQTASALNGSLEPKDFLTWRNLLPSNGARTIGLVGGPMLVPQVILVHGYAKVPTYTVKLNRKNVFIRDRYTCQYCGSVLSERELNIDHVVPHAQGGLSTWTNVVTSCLSCNHLKANRTPHEAGLRLVMAPRQPRWEELADIPTLTEWLSGKAQG